jgi:hypothetical protein
MQSIMSTGAGDGAVYVPARKVADRYSVSFMTQAFSKTSISWSKCSPSWF